MTSAAGRTKVRDTEWTIRSRNGPLSCLAAIGAGLGLLALSVAIPTPAAAADVDVRAAYRVTLAGLTIANVNILVAVRRSAYTARFDYRMSGAARLIIEGTGEAVSKGTYAAGRLIPSSFDLDHRGGRSVQKVALAMTGGTVKTMILDPPIDLKSDRVPIELQHLKNIVDPLSAFLISAVNIDGKPEIGACNRTLPVFDGLRRYDVALEQKETGIENRGSFPGPVMTCRIRVTPLAGTLRQANGTRSMSRNGEIDGIDATFGLVKALDLYIPISISARIGYGAVEVRLSQFAAVEANANTP